MDMVTYVIGLFFIWFFFLFFLIWKLVLYSKEISNYEKYYNASTNNMEYILINHFCTAAKINQLITFCILWAHIVIGVIWVILNLIS